MGIDDVDDAHDDNDDIRASNVPLMHIKVAANTPQPITSATGGIRAICI